MHIYKCTHIAGSRCYIRQLIQELNQRRVEHICNRWYAPKTYHFCNVLKKYGADEFTWKVINGKRVWLDKEAVV